MAPSRRGDSACEAVRAPVLATATLAGLAGVVARGCWGGPTSRARSGLPFDGRSPRARVATNRSATRTATYGIDTASRDWPRTAPFAWYLLLVHDILSMNNHTGGTL